MKRRMLNSDILSLFLKGDSDVIQNANNYLSHFDLTEKSTPHLKKQAIMC
jgi:hypothetical protein